MFGNCTNEWRLKQQTNDNAITVNGQKPMSDNSIDQAGSLSAPDVNSNDNNQLWKKASCGIPTLVYPHLTGLMLNQYTKAESRCGLNCLFNGNQFNITTVTMSNKLFSMHTYMDNVLVEVQLNCLNQKPFKCWSALKDFYSSKVKS